MKQLSKQQGLLNLEMQSGTKAQPEISSHPRTPYARRSTERRRGLSGNSFKGKSFSKLDCKM